MGRAGVKLGFVAMLMWFSCVIGDIGPFLFGGALLYLEEDIWLKKQAISMLVVYTVVSLISVFGLGYLFEILIQFLPYTTVTEWISRIFGIAKSVLFIWMGIRAYAHKPVVIGENLANRICGLVTDDSVCPNCGEKIGKDDIFCFKCGGKVR